MITQAFLDNPEYKEFKEFLLEERTNKPLKLKTDGKTNEMIAREVTAFEIASKLLDRTIKKFERQVKRNKDKKETWK